MDKDLTSALMANVLGIDTILILTAVPQVLVEFGKSGQRPLGHVTISLYSEEPSGSTQADTLIGATSFDVAEKLRASENKAADGAGGDVHQWLPLDGGVSGSLHVSLRMEDVPEA